MQETRNFSKQTIASAAWDLFCASTLLGIWPRFIEPKCLFTTHLEISFKLPHKAPRLRIVQLSDVHINRASSEKFIEKIVKKVTALSPDLIALTGDFLCLGQLEAREKLSLLLEGLKAPLGVYAVLGNHDFTPPLIINAEGNYDVEEKPFSLIHRGWKLLFSRPMVSGKVTRRARRAKPHPLLLELFKQAHIELLDNRTVQVGGLFNLTGLGEHMAGQARPEIAFEGYRSDLSGIVLVHNPDTFPALKLYPGELVLSGHTHGGQINLPLLWKRFTLLENPRYKSGFFQEGDKRLYVSRGLGSALSFRLNAPPEIVSVDLKALVT